MKCSDKQDGQKTQIICPECGAVYERLPAFTCPRCGSPLCPSGCEGCAQSCASKDQNKRDV